MSTELTKEDTVKKRYFFKLLSNSLGFLFGLVSITIVPRTLGPKFYGDFNYLNSSLGAVLNFMGISVPSAFFVYSSRENKANNNEVSFFFFFFSIIALFFLGILLTIFLKLNVFLWPHQAINNLLFMTLLVSIVWIGQIINGYSDSKALTVTVEKFVLLTKITFFILIVSLFLFKNLNLKTYIFSQIFVYSLLFIFGILIINKRLELVKILSVRNINLKFFWDYCYPYCSPLFWYAIFSFIVIFFDRWILQISSGSIQQGYYSLAFQIITSINIIVLSVVPIFKREIAKYNFQKDIEMIRIVFLKYMKIFYILSSFLSVIVIFQAKFILKIIGKSFSGALTPFIIFCFYPMYQTYGHLIGEMFYATERTKIYTKLGTITNTIGLLFAYIIMAPKNFVIPGLEMGAVGLSLKIVLINIFHVHVLLYYVCKTFNLKFHSFIIHQIKVLSMLFMLAILATVASYKFVLFNKLFSSALFCLVYSSLVILILLKKPSIFGIEKSFVQRLLNYIGIVKFSV